jgi:hypothetical protein
LLTWQFWCGHGGDPFCRVGDLVQLGGGEPDGDGHVVAVRVELDGELGDLEQPRNSGSGASASLSVKYGTASSSPASAALGRAGLLGGVEFGDGGGTALPAIPETCPSGEDASFSVAPRGYIPRLCRVSPFVACRSC